MSAPGLDSGCRILDARSNPMSCRNLEIWQRARQVAIDVHRMSLRDLPKFEMYEEGAQIRRSAHSIRSNIVEGYVRRRSIQYPAPGNQIHP